MIIMNERKFAEAAIYNRELGKRPYETIVMVAKYYRYKGFDKNESRKKLDDFIRMCEPTASITAWSKTLDKAIRQSEKSRLNEIDSIKISQREIDQVCSVGAMQAQRVAFTLLCLAKYYSMTRSDFSGWIPTPNNEIMKMANVSTSLERQSQILRSIRDAGLIRFSRKVDNTSIQVLFVCEGTDDAAMEITDFRNLGYQYMALTRPGFFKCEECGIMCKTSVKNKGRPPKYCEDCAVKVHVRQHVEKSMRAKKL